MKRIYISGKITGIEKEAFDLFENAEKKLSTNMVEIVNPFKLRGEHDKTWEAYMKDCIHNLVKCDEVYMLENWKDSRGAIIEHALARVLRINIEYESEY